MATSAMNYGLMAPTWKQLPFTTALMRNFLKGIFIWKTCAIWWVSTWRQLVVMILTSTMRPWGGFCLIVTYLIQQKANNQPHHQVFGLGQNQLWMYMWVSFSLLFYYHSSNLLLRSMVNRRWPPTKITGRSRLQRLLQPRFDLCRIERVLWSLEESWQQNEKFLRNWIARLWSANWAARRALCRRTVQPLHLPDCPQLSKSKSSLL